MFQNDDPSAAATLPAMSPAGTAGFFTDGSPGQGTPASILRAEFMNTVMLEMLNILSAAGIKPDKTKQNQLAQAIFQSAAFQTPPQFDATKKAATTEFVQRALGNDAGVTVLTSSKSLTAADCGQFFQCNGGAASSITLPPSSGLSPGVKFQFWSNATAAFTVTPSAGDTISDGVVFPASVNINTGDSVTFENKGGGSWLMYGSLQLGRASSVFGALIANTGWQKLPSGLIVQWGQTAVFPSDSTAYQTNFPTTFPTACYAVFLTDIAVEGSAAVGKVKSFGRASFIASQAQVLGAPNPSHTYCYLAIGS